MYCLHSALAWRQWPWERKCQQCSGNSLPETKHQCIGLRKGWLPSCIRALSQSLEEEQR